MKFGKRLKYESVVEWENKYLDYHGLKVLIAAVMSQMHAESLRVSAHGNRKLPRILKRESSHPANISINTFSPDKPALAENGTMSENENGQLGESGEARVEPTGNDSMANYSMEGLPLLKSSLDDGEGEEGQLRQYLPICDEGIPLLGSPKGEALPHLYNPVLEEGNSVRMKNMLLFKKFSDEMKKVNEFFVIKEAELQGYYGRLTDAVTAVMAASVNPTKLKELKTAFVEFYRGISMLQNYVELNREGFRKILKKHQKLTGFMKHKDQYEEVLHQQQFWKSNTWLEMMNSTEALYAKIFNLPRVDKAKNELLPIRLQDTSSENSFKLGLGVGACLAFICVIFSLFSHGKVNPEVKWSRFIAVIPVYRAVLIPVLAVWLWGCNVYIWTRKRINYTFIFGLDPRSSLDYRRIFKAAAALSAVWLASFFLFVATIMGNLSIFDMRPEIYPLILIVFNLALVLAPFRALHRRSRFLLFKTIGNVIISPFGDIHFLCLYVGDVLTSLVKTLFDIEYTICYYATGDWLRDDGQKCNDVNRVALPVISALPYFWRLLQCLKRYKYNRHPSNLGNAGKYGVACLVVIVGGINGYQTYPGTWTPMRYVWVGAFIFATLYNYLWDIFMDWDLGKRKYKLLRKQLLYRPHVWVYYYVICSNLLFRFAWTAYITPTQIYIGINPEFFATILACIEILRRFTWSVFRVEREQVANIGDNRAVTFASLGEDVHGAQNLPPVTSINGVWTGKGPFDVIVDKLISLSDLDFTNLMLY